MRGIVVVADDLTSSEHPKERTSVGTCMVLSVRRPSGPHPGFDRINIITWNVSVGRTNSALVEEIDARDSCSASSSCTRSALRVDKILCRPMSVVPT